MNNTAVGNTAIGSGTLAKNTIGHENTAVGHSTGQNVIAGFNNTYVGDFVGTDAPDEDSTIRIGDLSNGNGAGSLACFIGGIFNNFQPVGGSVVEVTLDLATDELGWDFAPVASASAPSVTSRGAPTQRKVGKVEKLDATVAQLKFTGRDDDRIRFSLHHNALIIGTTLAGSSVVMSRAMRFE